jgi:excisionase family DNA binding protein
MSAATELLHDRLGDVLAPAAVDAIAAFVTDTVRAEVAAHVGASDARKWLTVREAAERLGCSADAVRMRAKRGRLESRHMGRTLYIAAASVENLQ